VQVDVFRQSVGRRVIGNRLVARFNRARGFAWSGRATRPGRSVGDGYYFARLRIRLPGGRISERRVALVRRAGRFRPRPGFDRAASCALLQTAKLERSVFGGRGNRALSVTFRLSREARVGVEVLRGRRVVRRLPAGARRAGLTHRLRLPSERLRRGDYRIRITVTAPGERRRPPRSSLAACEHRQVTARLGAAIASRRAALDALRRTRPGRAALLAVAALAVFTAIGLALLWPSETVQGDRGFARDAERADVLAVTTEGCRPDVGRGCRVLQIRLRSGARRARSAPRCSRATTSAC
jgi:hypothetical protein